MPTLSFCRLDPSNVNRANGKGTRRNQDVLEQKEVLLTIVWIKKWWVQQGRLIKGRL